MTETQAISQIRQLILCGSCKRVFNDANLIPKFLTCKHYFCLECIQSLFQKNPGHQTTSAKSRELYCLYCWKLTELSEQGAETLETNESVLALASHFPQLETGSTPTVSNGTTVPSDGSHVNDAVDSPDMCMLHGMRFDLCCVQCGVSICQACANKDHLNHNVQSNEEIMKEVHTQLSVMSTLTEDVQQLAIHQHKFLFQVFEACITLKTHVQTELESDLTHDPGAIEIRNAISKAKQDLMEIKNPREIQEILSGLLERKRALQAKHQQMCVQYQLDALIGNSTVPYDFGRLQEAVQTIQAGKPLPTPPPQGAPDPILFLTNYCMSQLYSRMVMTNQQRMVNGMDHQFALPQTMQKQLVISQDIPIVPSSDSAMQINDVPPFTSPTTELNVNFNAEPPLSPDVVPQHLHLTETTVPVSPPLDLVKPSSPPSPPSPCETPPQMMHSNMSVGNTPPASQSSGLSVIERKEPLPSIIHPPLRPVPEKSLSNVNPRYYFYIEINSSPKGRIVIETRPDVAPKMCKNFDRLCVGDRKMSYKGCCFFQCWKGESVITGDFEYNNGRGGRSIYEDVFFPPDHTIFPAVRGAVGMRRQQKRYENFGLVGSVFRIVLQEMQGFTGIFGHVIEGIELVDKISNLGDHTGKPSKSIVITKCGKL